jgi:predicted Abi (CAAX) family protease
MVMTSGWLILGITTLITVIQILTLGYRTPLYTHHVISPSQLVSTNSILFYRMVSSSDVCWFKFTPRILVRYIMLYLPKP